MGRYSVLTTVYVKDKPEHLKMSIDSMLNQTVLTDDYVIVKDGPLNAELDSVINGYTARYNFFNIVALRKNEGLGIALNKGLQKCTNDLVARLDSDDVSEPNRCELQLKAFGVDPSLVIVGSDMYEFDNDPQQVTNLKIMPHTSEEIYRYGKRRNAFNHSSVMFRKSVIEYHGSYSPMRRSQDIELFSRILYAGNRCQNINKPLIRFRCNGTRVQRKKSWENVSSDIKIFYRNLLMGYTSITDFTYVLVAQVSFYILPKRAAGYLYRKIFRRSVKEKN